MRDWLELPLVCTLELILGEEVLLGLEGRASEVGRPGGGDERGNGALENWWVERGRR